MTVTTKATMRNRITKNYQMTETFDKGRKTGNLLGY